MTEPTPVVLISQRCQPQRMPESTDEISEAARLRAALTWSYECIVSQYGQPFAFSGFVFYGPGFPNLDLYETQVQFVVAEDHDETVTTITVRSLDGRCSMESLEVFPVDSMFDPLDFQVLEASPSQRIVRCATDLYVQYLTIRVSDLNVLQTNVARACMRAEGGRPVCFSDSLVANVDRTDAASSDIHLDKLTPSTTGGRELQGYLQEFFRVLLADVPNCTMGIGCDYTHALSETGVTVSIPIMMLLSAAYSSGDAESLAQRMALQLKQTYQELALPPHGTLVFRLKAYGDETTPVLQLGRLLLPVDSVADLSSTSS